MSVRRNVWQPWLYAAAGLSTAVAGKAALDDTGASWPTILVVVGLFVAASGIRGDLISASAGMHAKRPAGRR